MRAIGIHCSSDTAFLAIAEDEEVLADHHERLTATKLLESSDRLVALMADAERLVTEVGADAVAILLPERHKGAYTTIAPRAALETVLRVGACRAGVSVEMLSRPTARSRVGMPRSGSFEDHISEIIPRPVGKYWNAGRGLAAIAALAARC